MPSIPVATLMRKKIASLIKQKKSMPNIAVTHRLDQNANLFGSPLATDYHRHDEAKEIAVLNKISGIKAVPSKNILLTNSNYESVQLLMQSFCEPTIDNIVLCVPSMDYFSQIADLQSVGIKKVLLLDDFQLDIDGIAEAIDEHTKIIFLASPNDPTATALNREDIEIILNNFDGFVVLDETYINYARQRSFWYEIKEYENLIVLQNFDVAWGLASLNISMLFAQSHLIEDLNCLTSAQKVSVASLEKLELALSHIDQVNQWTKDTVMLRDHLTNMLEALPIVEYIYPSATNFILVKFLPDVNKIFDYLLTEGIVVKNCHLIPLCEQCLRISIGTPIQNDLLVSKLKIYSTPA